MEFLKTLKLHTLDDLIKAKDKDDMRGIIEAEIDLQSILMSPVYADFTKLYGYMKEKAMHGESILLERLLKTTDEKEEKRIISQVKHFRKLHKKFLAYAKRNN